MSGHAYRSTETAGVLRGGTSPTQVDALALGVAKKRRVS